MVRYKNIGIDFNSQPQQYRVWLTDDMPDLTGALYTGLKSGTNALVDISTYLIADGYAIVDFSIPLGTQWQSIPDTPFDFPGRKVLPDQVSDSQLVILDGYLDGYAYLFGGKVIDKIYRASLNNPADWIDTGATLPTPLYDSSLSIIDSTIYLFGGNTLDGYAMDGYGAVSTIFSAPVSDPLTWTNHGSLLPVGLHSSSLGMADGYVFLFGGADSHSATDAILRASTSDPLSWTIVGTLPAPLYGASIFQADGYWYLLGGQTSSNLPVNTIYSASISDPLTWQEVGSLPYNTSYGRLLVVGSSLYYMGPSPGGNSMGFTTILQAPLTAPTLWTDTLQVVPAVLSHSQSGIIYDRLWFFGGSGLSAIFACEQLVKYPPDYPAAVDYGNITRTILQSTNNLDNPFLALGMAYWRTDYQL